MSLSVPIKVFGSFCPFKIFRRIFFHKEECITALFRIYYVKDIVNCEKGTHSLVDSRWIPLVLFLSDYEELLLLFGLTMPQNER